MAGRKESGVSAGDKERGGDSRGGLSFSCLVGDIRTANSRRFD